jgi:hypothetical protein
MINEFISLLITALKEDDSLQITECKPYNGEFEETGEWNPAFPNAMPIANMLLPERLAAEKALTGKVTVHVYTAIKNDEEEHQQFLTRLITFLNKLSINTSFKDHNIDFIKAELYGFGYGCSIYRIEIEAEGNI